MNYTNHIHKTAGYQRTELPQLDLEELPFLVMHFMDKGIAVTKGERMIKNIKPAQNEINEDKVQSKIDDKSEQWKNRTYFLSSDNFLVDGHHDWAHGLEEDDEYKVKTIKIALPIKELVPIINRLKISYNKDIEDNKIELEKSEGKYGEGKKLAQVIVHRKGKTLYRKQIVGTKHQEEQEEAPNNNRWVEKYKHLNLNVYPTNIPEEHVEVDMTGDIDSHAVLRWKDAQGKQKAAYTEEFMQRSSDNKFNRIKGIKQQDMADVKKKAQELILSPATTPTRKDAACIIGIIAHTGLRPGSDKGLEETGNRGVSTLSSSNISIKGDRVTLNFRGKSYQQNIAEFDDPVIAKYLSDKISEKEGDFDVFNITSKTTVDNIFKDQKNGFGMTGFKIKDMRTWTAADTARQVLFNDNTPPPPLADNPLENKRLIQKKLNICYQKVADKLNNTPVMAKNSYIPPVVVDSFLYILGTSRAELEKGLDNQQTFKILEMDEILEMFPNHAANSELHDLEEEDEEYTISMYPLPNYMKEYELNKSSFEEVLSEIQQNVEEITNTHLFQGDGFAVFSQELVKSLLQQNLFKDLLTLDRIEIDGQFRYISPILEKAVKNNLVKKLITNKLGNKQTVWVSPEDAVKLDKHGALSADVENAKTVAHVAEVVQKHGVGKIEQSAKKDSHHFLSNNEGMHDLEGFSKLADVKKHISNQISNQQDKMQLHAQEPKEDGKYEKSGQKHTTFHHAATQTTYKQGDKVKFTGTDGKEIHGEFRHVNINKHSPDGYAVIKAENGKLYERVLGKISKHVGVANVVKPVIETKPEEIRLAHQQNLKNDVSEKESIKRLAVVFNKPIEHVENSIKQADADVVKKFAGSGKIELKSVNDIAQSLQFAKQENPGATITHTADKEGNHIFVNGKKFGLFNRSGLNLVKDKDVLKLTPKQQAIKDNQAKVFGGGSDNSIQPPTQPTKKVEGKQSMHPMVVMKELEKIHGFENVIGTAQGIGGNKIVYTHDKTGKKLAEYDQKTYELKHEPTTTTVKPVNSDSTNDVYKIEKNDPQAFQKLEDVLKDKGAKIVHHNKDLTEIFAPNGSSVSVKLYKPDGLMKNQGGLADLLHEMNMKLKDEGGAGLTFRPNNPPKGLVVDPESHTGTAITANKVNEAIKRGEFKKPLQAGKMQVGDIINITNSLGGQQPYQIHKVTDKFAFYNTNNVSESKLPIEHEAGKTDIKNATRRSNQGSYQVYKKQ